MKPVIRAAVFSDTHGGTSAMLGAIRAYRPDVVIHLGDCENDVACVRLEFPDIAVYNVCGNCDIYPLAPNADTVQLGPVKAYITHGHRYNVKYGDCMGLAYAAQEQGASIAMYGHTHHPDNRQLGGMLLLNPGTAGFGAHLTWATVEVYENGGIAAEIKEL